MPHTFVVFGQTLPAVTGRRLLELLQTAGMPLVPLGPLMAAVRAAGLFQRLASLALPAVPVRAAEAMHGHAPKPARLQAGRTGVARQRVQAGGR